MKNRLFPGYLHEFSTENFYQKLRRFDQNVTGKKIRKLQIFHSMLEISSNFHEFAPEFHENFIGKIELHKKL